MLLITVVCSLLLIQLWGSGKPLHKDNWFYALLNFYSQFDRLASVRMGAFSAALITALLLVVIGYSLLDYISSWLAAAFAILVLVYSMGRGLFSELVASYVSIWHAKDWEAAVTIAQELGIETHWLESDDWSELNHLVVEQLAYRGFERIFVVLFWFVVTGVVGPLAYRLVALYGDHTDDGDEAEQLQRLLWLVEWPVVRLFGLSLAITGNFTSCFSRCRQFISCTKTSSSQMLVYFVESALSVTKADSSDPRCGEKELTELQQLYSRTMVLWVCVIAVFTLLL
ncbi:regulatory signaling modulator protein AmpE [Halioxenophilus sp. WMMB6]|uniref:regulatory signaling modulator protein AmpE n=1 Tax=Halioxenophilus sp. WMMB6 TaxID=3073815 RepID=UPI00295EB933|nr:regulatory signaling modulator protein AmpE [Halioxenophilus sp. WMMB6]